MNTLMVHRVDRLVLPLDRRSAFTAVAERLSDELHAAAICGGEDLVVLNTCERFEVYCMRGSSAVVARLLEWRELGLGTSTVCTGAEVLRHLFRVASGLESRIRGEPHILGQVRVALNQARQRRTIHRAMANAFDAAIRCGKRVRRVAAFDSVTSDYASLAVARLRRELTGLEQQRVAVVGTGALATDVARALNSAGVGGLTMVGRHEARLIAAAGSVSADWLTLRALNSTPTRFDAVVTAIASSEPVIDTATLQHCNTRLFVDLGGAPNIDSRVDGLDGVRVIRLDDLSGRVPVTAALARAEAALERDLARYLAVRAPIAMRWQASIGRMAS
jgi:glutamyl-tRNA reductase